MPNRFTTTMAARLFAALALAASALATLGVRPATARELDPGRYEAVVGVPAPQLGGSPTATTCDGRIAFGTGDDVCGSMSGGPSGGNSTRN